MGGEIKPGSNPLIITLSINEEAQVWFNQLRKQHFPAQRNYLDAHITLFHHLPSEEYLKIDEDIRQVIMHQKAFALRITEVVVMGNGVAYKLESEILQLMHRRLQQQWQPWLTSQDKQKLWPHITIQNKVAPATARLLQQQLQQEFKAFEITGTGLSIWEYNGGPWEFKNTYNFK